MISIGIYLYSIIQTYDNIIRNYINKLCILIYQLGLINYRIIKEYNSIADNHYNFIESNLSKHKLETKCNQCDRIHKHDDNHERNLSCQEKEQLINYISECDMENKFNYKEFLMKLINNIYSNLELAYYLTILKKDDELIMKDNNILVNPKCVRNEKHNKLEKLILGLTRESRRELFDLWCDRQTINSKNILLLPFKYIMYDYRKIYRFLHNTKYFEQIYSNFDKDYNIVEKIVFDISECMMNIFQFKLFNLPKPFLHFLSINLDLTVIILDIFLAANVVNFIYHSGIFILPSIFSIIIGLVFGLLFHLIVIVMMEQIKNLITNIENIFSTDDEINKLDNKFKNIITEYKTISKY
jgi:hypothetical protein